MRNPANESFYYQISEDVCVSFDEFREIYSRIFNDSVEYFDSRDSAIKINVGDSKKMNVQLTARKIPRGFGGDLTSQPW